MQNQPPLPINPYAPPVAPIAPYPQEVGEMLARPSTRFAARFVDQLLLVPVIVPGVILGALVRASIGIAIGTAGALALFIYQWFLISTSGQSLAKRWTKIKVVRLNGAPVDFVSGVVMREWITLALRFVPGIGSIFGLTDALFVFRADQRCVHDHFAGTKVIAVP